MLLDAVITVLREVLEAALVIALFSLLAGRAGLRVWWGPLGLLLGIAGAWCYAVQLERFSAWADYTGQELVNAAIYVFVVGLMLVVAVLQRQGRVRAQPWLMVLAVAGILTREGSEVVIYLQGFVQGPGRTESVLLGSCIGAGIGVSLGVVCYYLLAQSGQAAVGLARGMLALFSAGLVTQMVQMLVQADWLAGQLPFWDSSGLISESSLAGELLFALFSYEATPTLLQLQAWLVTLLLFILLPRAAGTGPRSSA